MHPIRLICPMLAAGILLSGCNTAHEDAEHSAAETAETQTAAVTEAAAETSQTETTAAPEPERFAFNPHVYSPKLSAEIPPHHWQSFYNFCDALRKGEQTFACASQEAYDWVMDSCVLGHLMPPACMMISGESSDGSVPFEKGVGRIYYRIPVSEYAVRQAEFEQRVTDVLNSCLEPDDNDFEKCLKLYDYMESNYTYEDYPEGCPDGAYYYTFMNHKGVCDELSGVYMYLLLQVGIDAVEVSCCVPSMCHAWNYVILDGQGYHIDPTWSLKTDPSEKKLCLEYFMMTDEHRIRDGCPVDDLTVDLLPQYWANQSSLTFPATDDSYSTAYYSTLDALDEEHKILHYTDIYDQSYEMPYH